MTCISYGKILKTENGGGAWTVQSTDSTFFLYDVCFTNSNSGCAVGGFWGNWSSSIILRTTNGGVNWTNQIIGNSDDLYSVHFPDANNGFAVGPRGTILKTVNGGDLWTSLGFGLLTNFGSVHFPNENIGYATGDNKVYSTTDGGLNWNFQELGDSGYIVLGSIYFTSPSTGFLVSSPGCSPGGTSNIYKTTNGGTNWTICYSGGLDVFLGAIYFSDANTGYAVGAEGSSNTGIILKTIDGGITWSENNIYWFGPCSIFFTSPDYGYILGSDGYYGNAAIIKTEDGGNTWASPYALSSNGLSSVYFSDNNNGFIVGNNGSILYTKNGGGYPVGVKEKSFEPNSIKIYPNPSYDKINIESSAEGHLSILNLNGQELMNKPISKKSTQIDITNLPAGIYFIRVTYEKTVQVGKFLKE